MAGPTGQAGVVVPQTVAALGYQQLELRKRIAMQMLMRQRAAALQQQAAPPVDPLQQQQLQQQQQEQEEAERQRAADALAAQKAGV